MYKSSISKRTQKHLSKQMAVIILTVNKYLNLFSEDSRIWTLNKYGINNIQHGKNFMK